jgi:hypothetical protein
VMTERVRLGLSIALGRSRARIQDLAECD